MNERSYGIAMDDLRGDITAILRGKGIQWAPQSKRRTPRPKNAREDLNEDMWIYTAGWRMQQHCSDCAPIYANN